MSKIIQPYLYRFLCVSALNTVIDITVFNLLFFLIGDTKLLLVFIAVKGTSFIAAVSNSYIWNRRWTFKEINTTVQGKGLLKQFRQFLGINVTALIFNISIASIVFIFIQDVFQSHSITTNISAIAGSISGMLINLNGYRRLFLYKS